MLGTVVNAVAIIVGGLVGSFLQGGLREKSKETAMQVLGLAVVVIGMKMAIRMENALIVIGSLVLGGMLGEWIDIEARLLRWAKNLEAKFIVGDGKLSQAFVTTSLIYCIGAMAVTGSLESGLTGDHSTLFAKAMLDGILAIIFASTMGIGVALSSVSVFIYQGTITVLASWVAIWLTRAVITAMTATGGVLIIAIGINVLGLRQIRVGNLLPALFFAVGLALLF
ncbi:MAG: DUF554 domain-containing protein [bacterium]|nr:DUF554 domain-containing protein [bacterium]